MTFIFPISNLMFGRLIPNKKSKTIVNEFNELQDILGLQNFKLIFPAILTFAIMSLSMLMELEMMNTGTREPDYFIAIHTHHLKNLKSNETMSSFDFMCHLVNL